VPKSKTFLRCIRPHRWMGR